MYRPLYLPVCEYFENLCQAREAAPEYIESTHKIQEKVNEWARQKDHNEHNQDISTKELQKAIKKLKNGKSCGPDEIPNEIFTKADNKTNNIYKNIFNCIIRKQETPQQWQMGTITRLYKGKGRKGMCSNERGITVASNVGKVYERIINNRALKHINITDAQAGGKEGRSTTDHLLILKEIINTQKRKKKPSY